MQRIPFSRVIAFLTAFCLFSGFRPAAFSGTVVKVADGDSFTVVHDGIPERIRLFGIDCPEKEQAYSVAARLFTAERIKDKSVRIVPVTRDRYGRTIAWVMVEGINLNYELVRSGYAWHYKRYLDDPEFERLEAEARSRRIGLWADSAAVPPWVYRN